MNNQDPWWITVENLLAGAIGFVVLLIAFDLFGINLIHHSGKMARLSERTVYTWVSTWRGND